MTMTATGIPVPHLHLVWADLWPMLKPATLLAPDKPDLLARLLAGNAQLWAVYEGRMPIAAIVTEITLVPEKRCRIWLVGGTRMPEWVGDFLPKVEAWARSLGCVALWGSQSRPPD